MRNFKTPVYLHWYVALVCTYVRMSTLFIMNAVPQRFSNFFEVGTTFISQNVLRTTLLLGLSNSLGLP